jgi:hypothetical protein
MKIVMIIAARTHDRPATAGSWAGDAVACDVSTVIASRLLKSCAGNKHQLRHHEQSAGDRGGLPCKPCGAVDRDGTGFAIFSEFGGSPRKAFPRSGATPPKRSIGMSSERKASVEQRAYKIWEEEGRPHGRDQEHWHRAERDLIGHPDAAKAPEAAVKAKRKAAPKSAKPVPSAAPKPAPAKSARTPKT